MEIERYQNMAMRTSPEGHDRVLNGCMGLIGEAGEIVDLVKKWRFQSKPGTPLPTDQLVDECGDVLWYCAELATGLNVSLSDIYEKASSEFDFLRDLNETSDIELSAGRLAEITVHPFMSYDVPEPKTRKWEEVRMAEMKSHIVGIMATVRDFLEVHCKVTMSGAMDYNIAKLRLRYPDGFDPERSMNREKAGNDE